MIAGDCEAILRLLGAQFPPDTRHATHVADLGSLDGAYAIALAQAGYQVTGVEARERNMAVCRLAAESAGLPGLRFVKDDVRNLREYGPFDAVFCGGLLYHLDQPAAFLKMLGEITRRILIVQSHYSGSRHEENEGFRGHWYADQPGHQWGSYGNARSFWLGREDLMTAMRQAGFGMVWWVQDDETLADRAMFAGLKP